MNILRKSISKLIFSTMHEDMASNKRKKNTFLKGLYKIKKNYKETKIIKSLS